MRPPESNCAARCASLQLSDNLPCRNPARSAIEIVALHVASKYPHGAGRRLPPPVPVEPTQNVERAAERRDDAKVSVVYKHGNVGFRAVCFEAVMLDALLVPRVTGCMPVRLNNRCDGRGGRREIGRSETEPTRVCCVVERLASWSAGRRGVAVGAANQGAVGTADCAVLSCLLEARCVTHAP